MHSPLPSRNASSPPPVVLLVDDDPDTVDMYAAHLNGSGYCVATAQNGEDGRRTFDELNPDIVVTDLGMPGRSDGLQMVEHVANHGLGRVPVIVVTGHDRGSIPHAAAANVTSILVKPVLPDVLESEVRRTLAWVREVRRHAHQIPPGVIEKSNRLAERAAQIKRDGRAALGLAKCPGCGAALSPTDQATEAKYQYFQPCASGCGRFFRHRSTGRYYRLP